MQTDGAQYRRFQDFQAPTGAALRTAYSTQEVADLFGVSVRTIQNLIARGQLPALFVLHPKSGPA